MRIIRSIWKWWRQLWADDGHCYGRIDSHKWESKIEIFKGLARHF